MLEGVISPTQLKGVNSPAKIVVSCDNFGNCSPYPLHPQLPATVFHSGIMQWVKKFFWFCFFFSFSFESVTLQFNWMH